MILAQPLTVFYGRSGTGKTSLLLARVAPSLEEKAIAWSMPACWATRPPKSKPPCEACASDQLAFTDRGRRLVMCWLIALPPAGRLVIVLDQFEEFFIRQGEAVRQAFAQELAECLLPAVSRSCHV